jgi:hypothetical protein
LTPKETRAALSSS